MYLPDSRNRRGLAQTSMAIIIVVIVVVAGAGAYYFLQSGTGPSGPQKLVNIRFSVGVTVFSLGNLQLYTAQAFGFWKQQGVNVTWTFLQGGPLSVKALSANQSDVGYGAAGAWAGAVSSGVPVKVLFSSNTETTYIIAANTKTIPDVSHIKGTNWGVESIGGASYEIDVEYLQSLGLKPTDVNWVTVGSPALRTQALIAQKIDAAALSVEQGFQTAPYSYLHTLADTNQLGQVVVSPSGWIGTSQALITKHPNVVQAIVKGYLQTARALATNETLFEAAMSKMLPGVYNKSQIDSLYPKIANTWAVNGAFNQAHTQGYLDIYFHLLNPSATPVTLQQVTDYTFLKQALTSLGTNPAPYDKVDYSLS